MQCDKCIQCENNITSENYSQYLEDIHKTESNSSPKKSQRKNDKNDGE